MGRVLACGIALAALRCLGKEQPKGELFICAYLSVGSQAHQFRLSRRIVLEENVLMHTQGGRIPEANASATRIVRQLSLSLLYTSCLQEMKDPVIVRTAVIGVKICPGMVFTSHSHRVLAESQELDLKLGQLAIGRGHWAEALL